MSPICNYQVCTYNPEYTGKNALRSGGSGFMDDVSIYLYGVEGLKWALVNATEWTGRPLGPGKENRKPPYSHPFEYCVHSDWLIDVIDEIVARGDYPYNAEVRRLALQKLELPVPSETELAKEGTPLSLLIYNAQGFRRDRDLRAAGLSPLTQEMLDEAAKNKQQIELVDGTRCNVRAVEGKNYAFRPRKRNLALGLTTPAKLVRKRSRKTA